MPHSAQWHQMILSLSFLRWYSLTVSTSTINKAFMACTSSWHCWKCLQLLWNLFPEAQILLPNYWGTEPSRAVEESVTVLFLFQDHLQGLPHQFIKCQGTARLLYHRPAAKSTNWSFSLWTLALFSLILCCFAPLSFPKFGRLFRSVVSVVTEV